MLAELGQVLPQARRTDQCRCLQTHDVRHHRRQASRPVRSSIFVETSNFVVLHRYDDGVRAMLVSNNRGGDDDDDGNWHFTI
jgi:hypothetical protein